MVLVWNRCVELRGLCGTEEYSFTHQTCFENVAKSDILERILRYLIFSLRRKL